MMPTEIVRIFGARKAGRDRWKAKCPCHDDRSRDTLRITEGKRAILIHCWAGCDARDVLGKVGLRFRDLFYTSRDTDSAKLRSVYRQRYIDSLYEREVRMQSLRMWLSALECKQKPVRTKTRFECDIERFCARLERK